MKFHKTFGRTIRDSSSTCGTGLFPGNDHKSAVGRGEQAVWADGIDVLLLMAEECDLKCQSDPQKEYKKDSFEKSAGNKPGTSGSGTGGAGSSSAKKQDNYIVAPVKGDALFLFFFAIRNIPPTDLPLVSACCIESHHFQDGFASTTPQPPAC